MAADVILLPGDDTLRDAHLASNYDWSKVFSFRDEDVYYDFIKIWSLITTD